jgi:hypothetical protein
MTLKQAVAGALSRSVGHVELLELVRQHQPEPRKAYDELQQLWQELEFDTKENAAGQAELEFVMEKLWYSAPTAKTVK